MKTIYFKSSHHSSIQAFSLLEMLMVIAAVSTLGGVGVVAVQKTFDAGERVKLEADVSTLNRSVTIYLGNGGNLPREATATEVLTRLKMKVDPTEASSIVGHTGPFLDPRVKGVSISKKGPLRAVWNGTSKRFVLETRGEGFSEFVFDEKLGVQAVTTESRQTVTKFAKRESWVWDYDGNATAAPRVIPTDVDTAPGIPVVYTPAVERLNHPPDCAHAEATPAVLWPPNHKFIPVEIIGVVDPDNDKLVITVTSITQDEPTSGQGDGDKSPDAVITSDQQILVRSERSGRGDGRIYRINFRVTDGQGGSCNGSVTVLIPHSPNKPTVDSGEIFNSFSGM